MQNKTDLRIWAKSARKKLDIPSVSAIITQKIRQTELYSSAKNVLLFYPMEFEINLLSLTEDAKNFYLPRVEGKNLLICPYRKGQEMKVSSFKILEPCSEPVSAKCLDLVIVPALAVDKNGFRIGYGGGFYDRFLAQNRLKSIIPIARPFLLEKLPVEEFDVAADVVITD